MGGVTVTWMALSMTAGLISACGGHAPPPDRQPPAAVEVVTAAAAAQDDAELLEVSGTLRGRTSATLASRVMAPVRQVLVQPGDRVRAGQPLVLLDDRDLSAASRQARARSTAATHALDGGRAEQASAEAALVLARATHRRVEALASRRSATAQELDQAVAAVRAAETRVTRTAAGVEEAEAQLEGARAGGEVADVTASYARITAPFDGLVTEKLVEPGTLVSPGLPLLRLEDTRSFKLEVRIDESRAGWVTRDVPVRVAIDGAGGGIHADGRVFEIARAIAADSRTMLVTIEVPAADALRPGMFARAFLPGPSRRALRVPDDAIVRRGQLTSVFVAQDGKARLRLVSVGPSISARTEILSGLSPGELVVTAPPPVLRDGTPIVPRVAAGGGRGAAGGRP
jgi:RND family efflux transporter MFP subunit